MTDTKKKAAPKKGAVTKTGGVKKAKDNKKNYSRNFVLPNGVLRYSRSRMYKKTASYKIKPAVQPKPKKEAAPLFKEKPIGGDKNGGKRMVRVNKTPKFYPTEPKVKRANNKTPFKLHKHKLRKSITPGTVLILVAGRHRGKRVIFLKQLNSGLLLVTGPLKLNGCPLRRIEPIYVMATKTKVDISKVTLPPTLNDLFFKRKSLKRNKEEGDIFESKKVEYEVSQKRKDMQVEIDKQILAAIKAHPEKRVLSSYLSSLFWLRNNMYPHAMVF